MLELLHRSKEQRYAFDKIFSKHGIEEIYKEACQHLIKPVINGFNATIFAYGPTGSGKTFTMLGDRSTNMPGLAVLTVKDITEYIKFDTEKEFSITISYVEIYNEAIRDLLVPSSSFYHILLFQFHQSPSNHRSKLKSTLIEFSLKNFRKSQLTIASSPANPAICRMCSNMHTIYSLNYAVPFSLRQKDQLRHKS